MTEAMSTNLDDLARSLEIGFNRTLGFTLQEASASRVSALLELSDGHQQPFGLVHGGLYCAVVETLASVGAPWPGLDPGAPLSASTTTRTSFGEWRAENYLPRHFRYIVAVLSNCGRLSLPTRTGS
jgi:acyl-coenzyme A thioesterase PaaI-like protein